jgi:hypothetical protein
MKKHPYYLEDNPEKEINVHILILVVLAFLVVVITIVELIN